MVAAILSEQRRLPRKGVAMAWHTPLFSCHARFRSHLPTLPNFRFPGLHPLHHPLVLASSSMELWHLCLYDMDWPRLPNYRNQFHYMGWQCSKRRSCLVWYMWVYACNARRRYWLVGSFPSHPWRKCRHSGVYSLYQSKAIPYHIHSDCFDYAGRRE